MRNSTAEYKHSAEAVLHLVKRYPSAGIVKCNLLFSVLLFLLSSASSVRHAESREPLFCKSVYWPHFILR